MQLPMKVGSRSSLGTQHMQLDAPTRRVPAMRNTAKGGCCQFLSIGIAELHASLQYNRKVSVEMVISMFTSLSRKTPVQKLCGHVASSANVDSNAFLPNGLFGFKSCILCLDPVGLSTYTSMQDHYPYENAACDRSEQVPACLQVDRPGTNAAIQYLYWLQAQTPSTCMQSFTSKNRHIIFLYAHVHCIAFRWRPASNSLELWAMFPKASCGMRDSTGQQSLQSLLSGAGFHLRKVWWPQRILLQNEAEWDTPAPSQECSVSCWSCSCSWYWSVLVRISVLLSCSCSCSCSYFSYYCFCLCSCSCSCLCSGSLVHIPHVIVLVLVLFMFLQMAWKPVLFFRPRHICVRCPDSGFAGMPSISWTLIVVRAHPEREIVAKQKFANLKKKHQLSKMCISWGARSIFGKGPFKMFLRFRWEEW